ncbi:MAG: hypothetical protein M0R46_02240 [Candidatus Muirbacterium halophilum]|nr:hypothetical protein [Candidatus Muirbacterium halophilum]MCK9474709.1 hypothetical protein [Candidatus Muirbacterium halophilum]
MKKFQIVLIITLMFSNVFALVGVRNLGFGDYGVRAIGMGEAYSAISDDSIGVFYNPAGLAKISAGVREGSVMLKANLRDELEYDGAAFTAQSTETEQNVRFTISEYLERRLKPPVNEATVAYNFGVGILFSSDKFGFERSDFRIGVARKIHLFGQPNAAVLTGVKLGFTSFSNYVDPDNGKLVDFNENTLGFGVIYEFSEFLDIGLTIDNVIKDSSYDLPTVFTLGFAMHIDETTTLAIDGYNIINSKKVAGAVGDESEFRIGLEKTFIENNLTFRFGSKDGNFNMGFSMGVTPNFRIDYAYMGDYDNDTDQHFAGGSMIF